MKRCEVVNCKQRKDEDTYRRKQGGVQEEEEEEMLCFFGLDILIMYLYQILKKIKNNNK